MTSTIFDDITSAFLTALTAGTLSLGAYSLPLLGAFALIGWYWQFGRALALGGGGMGDALAAALLYAVNIGVAYWLLVNLSGIATAAYQTFLQWGLAAGGGRPLGCFSRRLPWSIWASRLLHPLWTIPPDKRAGVPCGISRRFSCMTSPPRPLWSRFPSSPWR